jgi:hypothetical protein
MSVTLRTGQTERSAGRRVLHLFGVMLLFLLLGPLAGGIVVITGLGIWIGLSSSPGDTLAVILAMMIYGLWASYMMGALPALLAGAVVGFMDAFRGGTSLGFAAALGAVMGIGWAMMMGGGGETEQVLLHVLVVLASVVATIACWAATRWRARG